jgi:Fe(3+) dicitrate transport protein
VFTDFYYQTFSQRGHDTLLIEDELINNLRLMQLAEFEKAPTAQGLLTSASLNDNDFAGFGVQSKGITMYGAHEVVYQARYHTDKAEMRAGGNDYLVNQDLSLTKQDTDYAIGKYTDDADALTTAVNAKLNYEKLSVNFGLGYEHVSVSRELGDNTDLLTAADFSDDGWIPSIEVAYTQNAWLFALSAKQAWTAAGAGNAEQLAQEALQYQLAINYHQDSLNVGLTAYMHDFDNMHSTCQWGVNCEPIQSAQQVNLKDVAVSGIDVSFDYSVNFDSYSIPLALDYRYTQAEFGETNCDIIVGCYSDGSQLPWVPEQQLSASIGFVMNKFSIAANALYQTETGSPFTPGNYGIDAQWNIDLAAQYQISKEHNVYVRVENLLDDDLIAKNYQMGLISQGELKTFIGYQGHF